MIHLEILSEEFYADTLSDCLSGIYTNVSEDDSSSEYSSDSDNVNIRQTKRQKKKKTLVINSDMESGKTQGAGEDVTGVSSITIKCSNP